MTSSAIAGSSLAAGARKGVMTIAGWAAIHCTAPQPPTVFVGTHSSNIVYSYKQSEQELSVRPQDYQSPYPPSADVVTRGLRVDHPEITLAANWRDSSYTWRGVDCLSWDNVSLTIHLEPHIYVAREVKPGLCRDTILAHERHHVDIDRMVMAEYAPQLRSALQSFVDAQESVGPIKHADVKATGDHMLGNLAKVVDPIEHTMFDDLEQRQHAFDSQAEYDRVGAICRASSDNPDDDTRGEINMGR